MKTSVDVLRGVESSHLLASGGDANGYGGIILAAAGSGNVDLYGTPTSGVGWSQSTASLATAAAGTPAVGNVFALRRIGNVYTARKNGSVVAAFTDSSNTIPRDASHRYVAFGGYNYLSSYRDITAFSLEEFEAASFFAMFDS